MIDTLSQLPTRLPTRLRVPAHSAPLTQLIAHHFAYASRWLRGPVLPVAAILALTGALSACGHEGAAQASTPGGAPPAAHVNVAAAITRAVTEEHEFSGRVEAINTAELRPRVSGYIVKVAFEPGSLVKKGDTLFVIDPRPYEAEVARAAAAAASSRARAELAKTELDRSKRLLADNAIAQRDFDERAAALRQLDASARADEASLQTAKLNLEWTALRAPFEGRVGKAEVTLGNLVTSSTVLTSLVSSDPIYVSFNGDEASYLEIGKLARSTPGAVKLNIGLANEAGFPHDGRLEFVDNQINPQTGSVRMRAVVNNHDGVLTPGLFARVQLGTAADGVSESTLVAERAIGTDQDRKFVMVVGPDNTVQVRPVTLGIRSGNLRVISGGLKAGERVIVDGLQQVRPGSPVVPDVVPMEAASTAPAAPPAG